MPVTFLTCSACCLSPRTRHDRRVSRPAAAGCLRPPAAARWRGGGGLPVARGGRWRVGARSRWKRPFDFPILVARYDFSSSHRLADVGGGSGGLALTVAQAYPHLHATVIDLPTVTPITRRYVEEAGLADRVRVMTADVVHGPLTGAFEVAVLSRFL